MKSNIYTRTGDSGTTSLVDGSRIGKDSIRLEAYGDIDELSSSLGFLCSEKDCPSEIKDELAQIQNLMFEIGGYLATPAPREGEDTGLAFLDDELAKLEGWIDSLDERTPKLNCFVLPGGSELSSRCHLARTICRRAERHIHALAGCEKVDPKVMAYINRLSDYLFVGARYMNFIAGVADIPWKKR